MSSAVTLIERGDCATRHGCDYAPGGNLKVGLAAQNSGLSLSGVLRKLTEGPKTTLELLAVPTHTSQVACVKLMSFSPSLLSLCCTQLHEFGISTRPVAQAKSLGIFLDPFSVLSQI